MARNKAQRLHSTVDSGAVNYFVVYSCLSGFFLFTTTTTVTVLHINKSFIFYC